MPSWSDGSSAYYRSTFPYLMDSKRQITVPMRVPLWSVEQQRLWSRLPGEDERVLTVDGCADVPAAQARAYLEGTCAMLTDGMQGVSSQEPDGRTCPWYMWTGYLMKV